MSILIFTLFVVQDTLLMFSHAQFQVHQVSEKIVFVGFHKEQSELNHVEEYAKFLKLKDQHIQLDVEVIIFALQFAFDDQEFVLLQIQVHQVLEVL